MSLAQVVFRRKANLPRAVSSAFKVQTLREEGQSGNLRSVTEEPIPSSRPEQRGYGHAICFQSRSQRNPPLLEGGGFCLFLQSLVCLTEGSQVHSKHMAEYISYSDDTTHL